MARVFSSASSRITTTVAYMHTARWPHSATQRTSPPRSSPEACAPRHQDTPERVALLWSPGTENGELLSGTYSLAFWEGKAGTTEMAGKV